MHIFVDRTIVTTSRYKMHYLSNLIIYLSVVFHIAQLQLSVMLQEMSGSELHIIGGLVMEEGAQFEIWGLG
jgi:hypothetical protein